MAEHKLYSMEELRKTSAKDRVKLMQGLLKQLAQVTLKLRSGKEKQSHLKKALQKQIAQIQTLERASAHHEN